MRLYGYPQVTVDNLNVKKIKASNKRGLVFVTMTGGGLKSGDATMPKLANG
jgi:hypothetical protein